MLDVLKDEKRTMPELSRLLNAFNLKIIDWIHTLQMRINWLNKIKRGVEENHN